MRLLIEVFEGIMKTIMGTEPIKLDLIYPELCKPEVHKVQHI